jgi:hypothetical protein
MSRSRSGATPLLPEVPEPFQWQRLQVPLLFEVHREHLALLAAVDAWRRLTLLPVREPRVLFFDRLEAAPAGC